MGVEHRIASSTNATTVVFARITGERTKVTEDGEKKNVFASFPGQPEDRKYLKIKKKLLGASYSVSNRFLLVARHTLTMGLQNCL